MAAILSIRGVLIPALFCLASFPAAAQSTTDECAAQAASQYEIGYEAIGRDMTAMDATIAVDACTRALADNPDSVQIQGWLARAHLWAGETDKAVPLFETAAAGDNVVALALYGDMLIVGDGVTQDIARGTEMLQRASNLGFAPAQNSLGLSYDIGEGVAQDFLEASRWYRAAAEQGLPRAQSNLGLMYLEGLGVDRDYVAAAAWLQRAADRGDAKAQYNLGRIY